MSDFHAIGGVSETLQTLLLDRMELPDFLPSVPVTIGTPVYSSKDADPHKEEPRVNLFLYRATENGYLQNQEIPGRGAPAAYGHPPLSLNLHYLITAYGNREVQVQAGPSIFDDRTAQYLLGSAMRTLHEVPVITGSLTTQRAPSGTTILHESLRDQYEQIKLSLEPLTLEDITKVWTALTLRYRLSAAYVVNVLQIESRRKRSFPRPVGQPVSSIIPPLATDPPAPGPMINVLTIQSPTITDIRVRRAGTTMEQPYPYARIGDTIVLRGTSLSGPVTSVAFGDLVVPASSASATRVEAVIPDASISGAGPIPAELQLQPGVRTVSVIVSNPLVPQGARRSNQAPFMLIPTANPATLAYGAGPPRSLTIQGARLVSSSTSGETVIGRSVVPRAAYINSSPTKLQVPIPDTLPARNVPVLVSGALPDPVVIGAGAHTLDIDINTTIRSVTANLPNSVARDTLPAILAALIHDAKPPGPTAPIDRRFLGARVSLWNGRLIVVPGELSEPIKITSPGGLTFANALHLTDPQPPGAGSAALSGLLDSPPLLSSANPGLTLTIGVQPAVTIAVPKAMSLAALAVSLQNAINVASPAIEYAGAIVATSGSQLLVIPGAAGTVTFGPTTVDSSTVVELQLHAMFAARVRVNGADTIDDALVELPQ